MRASLRIQRSKTMKELIHCQAAALSDRVEEKRQARHLAKSRRDIFKRKDAEPQKRKQKQAEGLAAISRWLARATPPVNDRKTTHPEGVTAQYFDSRNPAVWPPSESDVF
jgi:hypothetical protein